MAMALVRMLMLATIFYCILMGSSTAQKKFIPVQHIVGDSFGWHAPDNLAFYADWAKRNTFGVGDLLVFNYNPGQGNVAEVSKNDFKKCTFKKVKWMYVHGPTTIVLDKPGDYYYLNNIGKRCEAGQKLHITVKEGVQGNIGNEWDGKIFLEVKNESSDKESAKTAPAPSKVAGAPAPAPAPGQSAAAAIQHVGIASNIFTILLFSLFI